MRPKIHLCAKSGWINDPNGLVYFNGEYHLFYQYFPYEKRWGTMYWGHATTKDFVSYNYLDIALYPSIKYDMNGCFSGSAIVDDNKLKIYYTGVKYYQVDEEFIHVPKKLGNNQDFISYQLLIESNDGYHFDNVNGKKLIIDQITDETVGDTTHTRDPKVWKYNQYYYMVLGTKVKEEESYIGKILVYKSSDGLKFKLVSSFQSNILGDMCECPDLFEIDNQQFMIFSPENIYSKNAYTSNCGYMSAIFNYQTNNLELTSNFNYLDIGLDVYAPQTFLDEFNNRVIIFWIRMISTNEDYIGALTMPRIIETVNNKLIYRLHPSIDNKFVDSKKYDLKTDVVKFVVELNNNDDCNINGVVFTYISNKLKIDRSIISTSDTNNIVEIDIKQCSLTVYCDINIMEIFINNGVEVCTFHLLNPTWQSNITSKAQILK